MKGGKLSKEKLKAQLEKIAAKRTGGERTDAILDRQSGPEGLPHSIIVTAEGTEGEAPVSGAASTSVATSGSATAVADGAPALAGNEAAFAGPAEAVRPEGIYGNQEWRGQS